MKCQVQPLRKFRPQDYFLGKWSDLEMLLVLGSRERTEEQYRNLLRNSGFRMTRVVSTASPFTIVEATAA
jgi:C-methyltransferase